MAKAKSHLALYRKKICLLLIYSDLNNQYNNNNLKYAQYTTSIGFLGDSVVKNPPAVAGQSDSIPG